MRVEKTPFTHTIFTYYTRSCDILLERPKRISRFYWYALEMLKPLNFWARSVVHFSGPARNKIFYFRPVWARLGQRKYFKLNVL